MGSECHHADGAHPGLKGHALTHALGAAETRCVATQERLTAPRRRVLELLLEGGVQPGQFAFDRIGGDALFDHFQGMRLAHAAKTGRAHRANKWRRCMACTEKADSALLPLISCQGSDKWPS